MENSFKLKIEKIASQGFGLGFHESKAIFLPFSYPGEEHVVTLKEDKKNHSFATSLEILTPNKNRREVICPLFGSCGGCQFMDIAYDYQIELKKDILEESLLRIGKLDIKVNDIITSDDEFRYRNKGSFQVKNSMPGYCYPGTTRVFNFEKCYLLDQIIEDHVNLLSKEGKLDNLRMINVRSNNKNEVIDSIIKRSWFIYEVEGYKFIIDINSFFQVNKKMVPKWLSYLKSLLRDDDRLALDLYCGVGIISQYLSDSLESVTGIEINKRQIKQAKECLELNSIENAEYIFADAKEFLKYSKSKCDLLIVNPPRAGMDKQVTDDIIGYNSKHIIYSSCNPDTFSRDASRLIEGGYELLSVQPFDMFPQTHHLELVGDFVYKP